MVRLLARVIGIGIETADMLVQEVLSRNLRDRRAVARYGGLTGSPDESGKKRREKGLARSGNARVRRGMIQLAWRFLMFQKDSALAHWFYARTKNAPQTRKTMIVALARKLLIALWRLVREAPDACHERFLTPEETQRLLSALDADENQIAARAIKLLLLTGARRNEVTQAKWEHVNWAQRTLLVPLSKTGRPRSIRLNSAALGILRATPRAEDNPFIFPSPTTGRPSPSLHFPWLRIRKRAGLLDVRLHDLRHSFASFLVNNGVSLYVVQGLLGHLNARTTQRYAHLANETLSDAAETVADALLSGGNGQFTVVERNAPAASTTLSPARPV